VNRGAAVVVARRRSKGAAEGRPRRTAGRGGASSLPRLAILSLLLLLVAYTAVAIQRIQREPQAMTRASALLPARATLLAARIDAQAARLDAGAAAGREVLTRGPDKPLDAAEAALHAAGDAALMTAVLGETDLMAAAGRPLDLDWAELTARADRSGRNVTTTTAAVGDSAALVAMTAAATPSGRRWIAVVGDTARLAAQLDVKRVEAVAAASGAMMAATGDAAIAGSASVNDAFARAPSELSVDHLLRAQAPDGSFSKGRGIDGADIISTAFALLFLSKGRTPVLISKFAWGDFRDVGGGTFVERSVGKNGEVNWNRKHNDTRHLVEFASRELFKGVPLAWQVYDVRRQNIDTDQQILNEVGVLLQSPVLYLNGHGKIPFVGLEGEVLTTQEGLLQKYVD